MCVANHPSYSYVDLLQTGATAIIVNLSWMGLYAVELQFPFI